MLASAQVLVPAEAVTAALARVADDITARLAERYPLVLSVMGGAVVFTGNLLPLLRFPLDFDYLHVTRYGDATSGGELHWIAAAARIHRRAHGAGARRHPRRGHHPGGDPPAPAGQRRRQLSDGGVRRQGHRPAEAHRSRFRRRAGA